MIEGQGEAPVVLRQANLLLAGLQGGTRPAFIKTYAKALVFGGVEGEGQLASFGEVDQSIQSEISAVASVTIVFC